MCAGNCTRAAQKLGIGLSRLRHLLRSYGEIGMRPPGRPRGMLPDWHGDDRGSSATGNLKG